MHPISWNAGIKVAVTRAWRGALSPMADIIDFPAGYRPLNFDAALARKAAPAQRTAVAPARSATQTNTRAPPVLFVELSD